MDKQTDHQFIRGDIKKLSYREKMKRIGRRK